MNSTTFTLLHGRSPITIRLPASATTLKGPPISPIADPPAAVCSALQHPIESPPLQTLIADKNPRSVAVTISDITRPVPNELLLTALLDELNAAGVGDEQVAIIIATGMHRPSTPGERDIMLGKSLQQRCVVIDHQPESPDALVRISDDPPVSVNRRFIEADFRIVTGLIEPHFMAGFSGGRKGVCPALVDLNTVQRFHGYRIMGDPSSVEGRLDDNPCHEEAMRVAKLVGVDFLLNVAITHDRKAAGVYAGDMVEAHLEGCRDVARSTTAVVDEPFDLVVTNAGGFPLDQTFYQSVKGMVTALPALHAGSTLLIVSDCAEIGSPEYADTMSRFGRDYHAFLRHIETSGRTEKDQWQYQMHIRVLELIGVERLRFVNDGLQYELQSTLAVNPVTGPGDAAARAQRFIDEYLTENPDARVAVIPDGPYTMLTATEPAIA